jgi:hypothetical protein
MYKAIINFTDLQDNGRAYKAGDVYPREGYTPTNKRIEELSGTANKLSQPVIEYIEDEPETVQDELAEELPKRKKRKLKDDE